MCPRPLLSLFLPCLTELSLSSPPSTTAQRPSSTNFHISLSHLYLVLSVPRVSAPFSHSLSSLPHSSSLSPFYLQLWLNVDQAPLVIGCLHASSRWNGCPPKLWPLSCRRQLLSLAPAVGWVDHGRPVTSRWSDCRIAMDLAPISWAGAPLHNHTHLAG